MDNSLNLTKNLKIYNPREDLTKVFLSILEFLKTENLNLGDQNPEQIRLEIDELSKLESEIANDETKLLAKKQVLRINRKQLHSRFNVVLKYISSIADYNPRIKPIVDSFKQKRIYKKLAPKPE